MELKVIEKTDEMTRVALIGRLDVAGVGEIENTFLHAAISRKKPVIADLSELTFVTSIGLRMLIKGAKVLKESDAILVLLKPQELVEDTLASAGVDRILPVVHDEDQALDLLRNQ
jgi:anti-anti-sigma factor